MDNDDIPIGRILSRREALALLGGSGIAFFTGCGGGDSSGPKNSTTTPTPTPTPSGTPTATGTSTSTPTPVPTSVSTSCVARPKLTEGPYFVDEKLNRSDIRGTASGVVLTLNFSISQITSGACAALSGAMVDVWHANALGKYSDIASEGTSGQTFLRGYQTTPSNGAVSFTTIYPGWYSGRAVHIHYKVRITISGRSHEFTSQLFFNDSLTTQVFAANAPYNTRGTRDTFNSGDNIYAQGGSSTLLALSASGSGYAGTLNLGLDLT